jgi:hypothetical protein
MIRTMLLASILTLGCAAEAREADETGGAHEIEIMTPATLSDFEGAWEATSDDGTSMETAQIDIAADGVSGTLGSLERGYYSVRVTATAEVAFRGALQDGALTLKAWDVNNGSAQAPIEGRAFRRAEYLIIRSGTGESSYARNGVPLVRSAEASAPALKLASAIGGKIFSSKNQASGRSAFVGGRMKLALCADGTIAFDSSDVASTGGTDGVDMGSTTSRRGQWGIVLFAGIPVVKAQWEGTGSSYSLTRYFRIEPRSKGARVDGIELEASGSC